MKSISGGYLVTGSFQFADDMTLHERPYKKICVIDDEYGDVVIQMPEWAFNRIKVRKGSRVTVKAKFDVFLGGLLFLTAGKWERAGKA